ncbi:MAG: hypothetical protein JXR78_17985 [Victivallales bacterium]|nr:hypothetical protein [Victivallales bacterium]
MQDYLKSGIDCFDEMFNDDFVQNASEEDIEIRFQYLQKTCKRKNIAFQELLDELEFNCNSFIEDIIRP